VSFSGVKGPKNGQKAEKTVFFAENFFLRLEFVYGSEYNYLQLPGLTKPKTGGS
jgi:hypothetical protein